MRIGFFLFFLLSFLVILPCAFSEEVVLKELQLWEDRNRDNSLDWDTFYKRWEDIPDEYYVLIRKEYFHEQADLAIFLKKQIFFGGIFYIYQYREGGYGYFIEIKAARDLKELQTAYRNNYKVIGTKREKGNSIREYWDFMLEH
jgi:hypothetical protein